MLQDQLVLLQVQHCNYIVQIFLANFAHTKPEHSYAQRYKKIDPLKWNELVLEILKTIFYLTVLILFLIKLQMNRPDRIQILVSDILSGLASYCRIPLVP